MTDVPTSETRAMTASRVIKASPGRIYDAFLDPDELAVWLPPPGFTAEVHHLVPVEGGTYRMTFYGDAEEVADFEQSFGGIYVELARGERIVYTDEFESDEPAMAGEMTVTVTFEAIDEGTEVTVHQENIPDAIPPSDANEGWNASLESLGKIVRTASALETTDTSVTVRRTIDAPIEDVWRAFTDPNELERWYGSDLLDVEIHALEAEPGGSFSITMRDTEAEYDIEGEFLDVIEREYLVHTWYVGRVTIEFEDIGGGTEVVLTHEDLPDREIAEQHAEGWMAAIETLATTVRNGEIRGQ